MTVENEVIFSDLKFVPANEETPELAKNSFIKQTKKIKSLTNITTFECTWWGEFTNFRNQINWKFEKP